MNDFSKMLEMEPYSLAKAEKEAFLTKCLGSLTIYHYNSCPAYRKILDALGFEEESSIGSYYDLPFLPVRLFKEYDLKSIGQDRIQKTMTSSGTTGQSVSKIYLDKDTSAAQSRALSKIVSSFIGKKRLPMVILDTSALLKNRSMFSARGAGILGFSMFARDKIYAMDENMRLNIEELELFLEKHAGEEILLYGFTFMVWQHFYKELLRTGYHPDLSKGMLIHGGGWKKLLSEAVSKEQFREGLYQACGIRHVHDYYGMVEQTGTIYMECECGHLHTPAYSDIIIRRAEDFKAALAGEEGIIEAVSVLPGSYPGHMLLTEDSGVILGEDDCPCGRLGKYFKVTGRIAQAEIRGCSDTYAAEF